LQVFAATLAVLLAAYFAFRLVAGVGFARLNVWIHRDSHHNAISPGPVWPVAGRLANYPLSRKLLGVLAALAIDLAAVLLAALAGYVAAAALAERSADTLFAF